MKKIILIMGLMFLLIISACAQTTIMIETGTLAWDAPLDMNGGIIPAAELSYEIYSSYYPISNPQDVASHTFLGTAIDTTFPLSLEKKKTAFGVRATRTNDGDIVYSDLAWSFIVEDADPSIGPWIARWLPRPGKSKNLKIF